MHQALLQPNNSESAVDDLLSLATDHLQQAQALDEPGWKEGLEIVNFHLCLARYWRLATDCTRHGIGKVPASEWADLAQQMQNHVHVRTLTQLIGQFSLLTVLPHNRPSTQQKRRVSQHKLFILPTRATLVRATTAQPRCSTSLCPSSRPRMKCSSHGQLQNKEYQ